MIRAEQGDGRGEERAGAKGIGVGGWEVVEGGGGMVGRYSADPGKRGRGRLNACWVLGLEGWDGRIS